MFLLTLSLYIQYHMQHKECTPCKYFVRVWCTFDKVIKILWINSRAQHGFTLQPKYEGRKKQPYKSHTLTSYKTILMGDLNHMTYFDWLFLWLHPLPSNCIFCVDNIEEVVWSAIGHLQNLANHFKIPWQQGEVTRLKLTWIHTSIWSQY